jgi:hypothetical protein
VNDENVVNPPQIPTIRNNLHSNDKTSLLEAIPVRKPIKKLPAMLTKRVPRGIEKKYTALFSFENKYLAMLPIKPPIPTINKFYIPAYISNPYSPLF